jgi:hypothetical protein
MDQESNCPYDVEISPGEIKKKKLPDSITLRNPQANK